MAQSNADRIIFDSYERALECTLLTSQQANILHHTIVSASKHQIDQEYHARAKRWQQDQRINRSALITTNRMHIISHKHHLLQSLFKDVEHRLLTVSASSSLEYRLFLLRLIVEGLIRMFEDVCVVRCLERDRGVIEDMVGDCKESFNYCMRLELDREYPMELIVSKVDGLGERDLAKERLSKNEEDKLCIGGIVLTNLDGTIVYKNTLDSRVNVLREVCLSDVNRMLWGR